MDIQLAALWFCVGAFVHYLVSKIIGMYHGMVLFQEMEKFVAVYLVALIKDIRTLLKYRFESLANSKVMDEKELEKVKESDAVIILLFEEVTLFKIRSICPKYYLPYLKYSSWRELEDYADKQTKNKKE